MPRFECTCCGNQEGDCYCIDCEGCDDTVTSDDVCSNCNCCTNGCCECCYCENCGDMFHSDHYCHDCDMCDGCCECNANGLPLKHQMSDRFYRLPYEPAPRLFFGIENEMEPAWRYVSGSVKSSMESLNASEFYASTTDASLSSNGIEIKTRPFTFEWLKKNPNAFDPMAAVMQYFNADREERCGMHINMSRNYFTNLEEYKLATIIEGELTKRVSDRVNGYTTYCDPRNVKNALLSTHVTKRMQPIGNSNKAYFDKYNALAGTSYQRLEVRVFQATTKIDTLYKNLQYCHAVASFVKQSSVSDGEDKLLSYIHNNGLQYKQLDAYLKERELY